MISVIIATYNSESTLSKTLDSLFQQTDKNFECIVIDGNSNDSTLSILKNYKIKFSKVGLNLFFKSENDEGIYDAWNKGLNHAKGDFISFLGSDDWYDNKTIQIVNDCISDNSFSEQNFTIVGNRRMYSIDGKYLKTKFTSKYWKVYYPFKMPFSFMAMFINKNIFKEIGNFDDSYKFSGDYDFVMRMIKNKKEFIIIDNILLNMSKGGFTNSPKFFIKCAKEDLKVWKKYYGYISYLFFLRKNLLNLIFYLRDGFVRK